MAKGTLAAFVNGTRQLLTLQLLIGVAAVGLAGWTATVTTDLVRERNALSARVIQLEAEINKLGGELPPALTPGVAEAVPTPTIEAPPMPATTETPETPSPNTPATTPATTFNPDNIITQVLPPPAISLVVLHVRAAADRDEAERIARSLGSEGVQVTINVMSDGDDRASGYAYFDRRQARAAAALAARVQEAAKTAEIARWDVSLTGAPQAASAAYAGNRVDFVMPPLPTVRAPGTRGEIIGRRNTTIATTRQPPPPPPIR